MCSGPPDSRRYLLRNYPRYILHPFVIFLFLAKHQFPMTSVFKALCQFRWPIAFVSLNNHLKLVP